MTARAGEEATMLRSERFTMRLTLEDRRALRHLAAATQRSEGDVLRVLVRAASAEVGPERPTADLPGEARRSEREAMAPAR